MKCHYCQKDAPHQTQSGRHLCERHWRAATAGLRALERGRELSGQELAARLVRALTWGVQRNG